MSSTTADAAQAGWLERFEPRDRRVASRAEALRLAREARVLPEELRWSYLLALRDAARHDAPLPPPTALGCESSAVEALTAYSARNPSIAQAVGTAAQVVGTAWDVRRFALAGMVAGLAAAVLLPSSLSESLPGTSGNDRGPVRAGPSAQGSASAAGQGARPPAISTRRSSASRTRAGGRRSGSRKPASPLRIGSGALAGTGSRDLGTVSVNGPAMLRWSSDGRPLVIRSAQWRFRARERRGTTVLSPGTYRRFAVRSTARWRLRLDAAG
jgi:hypothetical protein